MSSIPNTYDAPIVYVGDDGAFVFIIYDKKTGLAVDLTSATIDGTVIKRPTGASLTPTCPITDAANGEVTWTRASGDINIEGQFKVQVTYTLSGQSRKTHTTTFQAHPILV